MGINAGQLLLLPARNSPTAACIQPDTPAKVVAAVTSFFPVIPLTTRVVADRFGGTAMGGILGSAWPVHQLFAGLGVLAGGVLREAPGSYSSACASGAVVLVASTVLTFRITEGRY